MTTVRFFETTPSATEERAPAVGGYRCRPTRYRVIIGDPDERVLPKPFPVRLDKFGRATAELEPSVVGEWAWCITRMIRGVPDETVYIHVPTASSPLDFPRDFTPIDPETLDPDAEPEAAWWAALEAAQLGVQAVVDPMDPDLLILTYASWYADPVDPLVLNIPIQEA